jgi:hypothetical protein
VKRFFVHVACLALVSCSSSPDKPKASGSGDLLVPLAAGATALDGAVEVVSVRHEPEYGVFRVSLRATGKAVNAFARPRWFGDASLKREFRAGADGWTPVTLPAGEEIPFVVAAPYPFAATLGLEVSAARPKAAAEEGEALPGRIVVTPEQEKSLAFYRYPDLELTQYESAKHAGAPKLAVWRDARGKVVAALEIYVRADAKAPGKGVRFLHTNGRKQIGTSLAYADTKKGGPSEDGWDFAIFEMKDGSEVAVPWRPLVKNASYCGALGIGGAGLDASQLGGTAQIGSYSADGIADFETAALEPPSWSMANPTGGSLASGAPVTCEYSGDKAQRWTIRITDDMVFTPSTGGGGGTFGCGTLPAGTGTTQLGMLHSARPGKHQFLYESETLREDPTSPERLTTSDGPVCPGNDPSTTTEILTDAGQECVSDIPGSRKQPSGEFTGLVIPCLPAGGTAIHLITQTGTDPGFVAVACDGEEKDEDLRFDATPVEELEANQTWIAIDNGVFMCPEPEQADVAAPAEDPCKCEPCRLVVVLGRPSQGLPGGWERDDMQRELDRIDRQEFAQSAERRQALVGDATRLYGEDRRGSWTMYDLAINAARRYARSLASANLSSHFHLLIYDSLDASGTGAATMYVVRNGAREPVSGFRNSRSATNNLARHFANCHKWDELLFIFHGETNAFRNIAAQIRRMITTPVRRIVFWSCWGADNIRIDSPEFTELKNHLIACRCNCPPRREASPVPPAAHPAGLCTACPQTPDHCPYEGTTIITAGTIRARVRGRDTDIAVPLGIDFRGSPARYVLTSPDGQVRVITISPDGSVTESTQTGGNAFGTTPLEADPGLGERARLRRGAR